MQTRRSRTTDRARARWPRLLATLVVLCGATALAAGTNRGTSAHQAAAWPMSQGGNPARTRHLPGQGPDGDPVLRWSLTADKLTPPNGACNGAAAADGVLYINGCNEPYGVYAIAMATGEQLWWAPGVDGHMVIDGDGLIMRSHNAAGENFDLVRLSRDDGSVVWRAEEGQIQAPWTPVVADGVGYMPSGDELVAFDPATGDRIWNVPLDAPPSRGASIAGGIIVIGDKQGTIYGLSVADGQRLWTFDVEATTIGHPALANGMAYVAGNDIEPGALYALDLATGELRWSYTTISPDIIILSPSADERQVYATAIDGTISALDARTGEVRWRFATRGYDGQSVAIVGDTVYIQSGDEFVYALDRLTGTERWRFALDAVSCSSQLITGGVVYAGSCDGTLHAIGGADGAATPAT